MAWPQFFFSSQESMGTSFGVCLTTCMCRSLLENDRAFKSHAERYLYLVPIQPRFSLLVTLRPCHSPTLSHICALV